MQLRILYLVDVQALLGLNSKPLYLSRTQHPLDLSKANRFNAASASTTALSLRELPSGWAHGPTALGLKTPIVEGGNQIMPRSTMPVRAFVTWLHFTGMASPEIHMEESTVPAFAVMLSRTPVLKTPKSDASFGHGSLAATMAMPGDKTVNDEGKPGLLSKAQRDDLEFLLGVHIRSTPYTNKYLNVPKGFRPLSHQRRQRSEATPTKCLW